MRRNGVSHFIGKEPPVEDTHQMNLGKECAKSFQVGSPTYRFYISLSKSAKRSRGNHIKWIEETFDE
jgi:hypothetical protein